MLKQLQKMQQAAMEMQEKFKTMTAKGAAAGLIEATVSLHDNKVISIDFKGTSLDEVLGNPHDPQLFCDLCMAAVNNAVEEANRVRMEHLNEISGGMGGLLD